MYDLGLMCFLKVLLLKKMEKQICLKSCQFSLLTL